MSIISNNANSEANSIELNGKERANKLEEKNINVGVNSVNEKVKANEAVEKTENTDISHKQMEAVAQKLQDFVGEMNKGLEFSVDQDSGRDVIKVIDKNNGDIIKQYPTEEVLDLVSKLSEATGTFINETV